MSEDSKHEHKPEHKHEHSKHTHAHKHATHTKRESSKKQESGINWPAILIGAVSLIIIAFLLFRTPAPAEPVPEGEAGQYGSVDVDFYVMSQCPYGTQVEDAIAPVLKELGTNVDFSVNFIAQDNGDGSFESLHGANEVTGDKIHLCVQEHYPDKIIDFIACQNKNYHDLESTVDSCAEEAGIDAETIKTCYKGTEGSDLLSASIGNSNAVQAMGSPTIYVNGALYQGGRSSDDFKRAICQGLEGHPNCEGIPACSTDADCTGEPGMVGVCKNPGKDDAECTYEKDAYVGMTVLNVPDCAECDATQLTSVLLSIFLNMEVEEVDATSAEGKAMIEKYGLEKAPSFIFTSGIADTHAWGQNPQIQAAFRQVGDDYVMIDDASGATYILDEKARAEIEKKVGVVKGDNRPQIDFYVMSYCPYGNMAEEAIEPVYRLLGDKADFNAHYVYYSNYASGYPDYCYDKDSQYCSMHGVVELHQDIRERCVEKYMGTAKMFDFMLAMNSKCNSQNADTCWTDVAKGLGLDTKKIQTCFDDEAMDFLEEDKELNGILGVSGSPTVFIEGKQYGGARTPIGFAQALCAAFENAPSECDADSLATLSGGSDAAAPAGGCG